MPTVAYLLTGDSSDLKKALAEAGVGLEDVEKKGRRTTAAVEEQTKKTGSLAESWKKFGPVLLSSAGAAVAAAAGIFKLVGSASSLTDEIAKTSGQLGIATETVVALKYAAIGGGASSEELTRSLTRLTAGLSDAHTQGGVAAEAFSAYGIAIDDAAGQARSTNAVFRDVLDVIAAQATQSKRTEVAIQLLGSQGGKVAAVFAGGSASLDKWTQNADVAAIAAATSSGSLNDYNQSMAGFTAATDAAKVALGEEFLPDVVAATEAVTAFVGPIAQAVGVLRDIQYAFDSLNPLVLAYRAAMALAGEESAKAAATADAETQALRDQEQAYADLNDEIIAGFVDEAGENAAQRAERAERRKQFKAEAEAEIALQAERAKAAEAWAARSAEASAKAQAAFDSYLAASIEGVQAIASNEGMSIADRREALEGIRDDYGEQVSIRGEAIEALAELDAEELANDRALLAKKLAARDEWNAAVLAQREEEAEALQAAADQTVADQAAADAAALAKRLEANQAIFSAATQLADALGGLLQQQMAAKLAALDEELEANRSTLAALLEQREEGYAAMSEAERARLDASIAAERKENQEIRKLRKKQMHDMFLAQQASAIVSIAVDTAVGSIRAFADLGPVAGAIAAGLISAAGTVAVGTVLAQKEPSMHDGGLISAAVGGRAPDEVPITAQSGEFVANSRLTSSNREELEEGNRTGRLPGGGVTVQIGNRALTDYVLQEARSGALRPLFADPAPSAVGAWR